jgi:hypothetical protein
MGQRPREQFRVSIKGRRADRCRWKPCGDQLGWRHGPDGAEMVRRNSWGFPIFCVSCRLMAVTAFSTGLTTTAGVLGVAWAVWRFLHG